MDFAAMIDDNDLVPARRVRINGPFPTEKAMIKTPKGAAPATRPSAPIETEQQRFERILLRPRFKPLKAVFDNLGQPVPVLQAAIIVTYCYENFLGELGYRTVIVNHIHESDCYARVGPNGGIRAVLPVHDVATYSTMVLLVNFDSTVTTTTNAIDFYDDQLREFKIQLMNKSGDAG
jgi:hypothetical protein